jgi:hypothetical protein
MTELELYAAGHLWIESVWELSTRAYNSLHALVGMDAEELEHRFRSKKRSPKQKPRSVDDLADWTADDYAAVLRHCGAKTGQELSDAVQESLSAERRQWTQELQQYFEEKYGKVSKPFDEEFATYFWA